MGQWVNTLRPEQNGSLSVHNIFKIICFKMIFFWLKFPWDLLLLVQLTKVQHWHWRGDSLLPLNQWWPSSPTHICITRPWWVEGCFLQLMQFYVISLSISVCISRTLPMLYNNIAFNTLRLRQNPRHFADIFKCIFLNENVSILLKISLKFVPKVRLNNIPSLV